MRRTGARIVHAHNLNPSLGWRALAAARGAGARTVLHLHNYRLVCAVGTCFTQGADCTRCHGRNTAPGVRRNCRGTGPEAAVYGASLALWQRRMLEHADAVIVPSAFALERLRAMGAPLQRTRCTSSAISCATPSSARRRPRRPRARRLAAGGGEGRRRRDRRLRGGGAGARHRRRGARARGAVGARHRDEHRVRGPRRRRPAARSCARGGPGDRALALSGDVRPRRGRGDGGGAAGRGQRDRRADRSCATRPGSSRPATWPRSPSSRPPASATRRPVRRAAGAWSRSPRPRPSRPRCGRSTSRSKPGPLRIVDRSRVVAASQSIGGARRWAGVARRA